MVTSRENELAKALGVISDHFGGQVVIAGKMSREDSSHPIVVVGTVADAYFAMNAPGLSDKDALLILTQSAAGKAKDVLDA